MWGAELVVLVRHSLRPIKVVSFFRPLTSTSHSDAMSKIERLPGIESFAARIAIALIIYVTLLVTLLTIWLVFVTPEVEPGTRFHSAHLATQCWIMPLYLSMLPLAGIKTNRFKAWLTTGVFILLIVVLTKQFAEFYPEQIEPTLLLQYVAAIWGLALLMLHVLWRKNDRELNAAEVSSATFKRAEAGSHQPS